MIGAELAIEARRATALPRFFARVADGKLAYNAFSGYISADSGLWFHAQNRLC
jgi:hypothetical protein